MALFSRTPPTRAEIVAAADRARERGRVRRAVAGYRAALETEPDDPSVNVKLGPLLARLGDRENGAACFRIAAQRHLDGGFLDRAAAVNVTAARLFPLDAGFWREIARLELLRGRRADALGALVAGGRALARGRRRDEAIALLRLALGMDPASPDAVLALAPLLARSGQRAEARRLLEGLDARLRGPARRRARWVALRLFPGPRSLWRWLRSG